MANNSAVVQLRHVMREFGSKVKTRVLYDIDLELRRGEFCALIGPSGSGKSTLLNIMGLLDQPTSGEVLIDGQATTKLDEDALTHFRGRTLGFVFQFHHLMAAFSALENVMIPAWGDSGRASPALRTSAEALLREVGLGARINSRAGELSGGESQRVAIARALVVESLLVGLPFVGQSHGGQRRVQERVDLIGRRPDQRHAARNGSRPIVDREIGRAVGSLPRHIGLSHFLLLGARGVVGCLILGPAPGRDQV